MAALRITLLTTLTSCQSMITKRVVNMALITKIILLSIVKKAPILSTEEAKSFLDSKRYLLSTPNVISLGFSNEKVDGKKSGGKVFRVGVIKKQPKEKIKHPDIFIPKFFKHTLGSNNKVVVIPVTVVEDGELKFIGNDVEHGNAGTANDDAKYKGGSLIRNAKIERERYGCLGANAEFQGVYRLLSAAHVLTEFDPENLGGNILVRNFEGAEVPIGATVTGHVPVELYDTPNETNATYASQDLAWADITRDVGSPEIDGIPEIPNRIRRISSSDSVVQYSGGSAGDFASYVDVESHIDSVKIKTINSTTEATKYAYFEDLCRIEPFMSFLKEGDSGTAIVAESDSDLVGILIGMNDKEKESKSERGNKSKRGSKSRIVRLDSPSNVYYFCKLA